MSAADRWLLALAAVVGGLVVWVAFGKSTGTGAGELAVTADVDVSDRAGRPHVAQASDVPGAIRHRHPLYRRPHIPRPAATALMGQGWSGWITDPPSEEED